MSDVPDVADASDAGGSRPVRIAPSILSADFARLADEVADVAPAIDVLHVDVMDGHYVPNLTIGPDVVAGLRRHTDLPFDTHLMIADPRTYGPQFVAAGSTSITFHPSTDADPRGLIDLLHAAGAEVGVAVRPSEPFELIEGLLPFVDLVLVMSVEPGFGGQSFMPEVLPKVTRAAQLRDEHGYRYRIEVDGGVNTSTIAACVAAGADLLVAGSAVFNTPDRQQAVRNLLAAATLATSPATSSVTSS